LTSRGPSEGLGSRLKDGAKTGICEVLEAEVEGIEAGGVSQRVHV